MARDPWRAWEFEMPRSRLTSVLFVAMPDNVAQDHEVLDIGLCVFTFDIGRDFLSYEFIDLVLYAFPSG